MRMKEKRINEWLRNRTRCGAERIKKGSLPTDYQLNVGRELTKIEQIEVILFAAQRKIMEEHPELSPESAYTKAEEWVRWKLKTNQLKIK